MSKHFQTHQGYNACNRKRKDNMTEIWYMVRCKLCKRNDQYKAAKQDSPIDHPVFRKALADKGDMKLEVTPEESKQVQEICFSLDIGWAGGKQHFHDEHLLFIDGERYAISYEATNLEYFENHSNRQFSFKDDCFTDEIQTTFLGEGAMSIIDCLEVEKSACGRTLDKFLAACDDDCGNVEVFNFNNDPKHKEWDIFTGNGDEARLITLKYCINKFGFKNYRIKEPSIKTMSKKEHLEIHSIPTSEHQEKTYAITEEQIKDIDSLLHGSIAVDVRLTYKDMESMLLEGICKKDKAIQKIIHIIDKIKGDLI